MRIEKWGFLLSYAIYLVFCIGFSVVSNNIDAINSMVCAITIASTAFSISDFLFTKFDIDKKEMEALYKLYYISRKITETCTEKIRDNYGSKANKMISMLMELFGENSDEITKLFDGNLSLVEKEDLLNSVEAYSNNELTEFVMSLLEADNSEIKEMISEDESEESDIYKSLNKYKKNETIKFVIASSIAVLGLVALLIILTLRVNAISVVNNVVTVVAFFSVIINLILKEYYKSNSLKNIEQEKNKLIKELRTLDDN